MRLSGIARRPLVVGRQRLGSDGNWVGNGQYEGGWLADSYLKMSFGTSQAAAMVVIGGHIGLRGSSLNRSIAKVMRRPIFSP